MGRLTLLHVTFTGTNIAPASVDFSPHVTVIHGPSDTGKSFIVDAIDFVLGAKELKEIPEREGYSRVLLGLELPAGERITLARSVDGGSISLYRSDIRIEPLLSNHLRVSSKTFPTSASSPRPLRTRRLLRSITQHARVTFLGSSSTKSGSTRSKCGKTRGTRRTCSVSAT